MIKNSKKLLEFKYLNQLFHRVRIVDPIKKIVIEENGEKTTENKKCFHLCNRDTICENCISIRAYNENTSVMKFEYIDNNIYMIMATPVNKQESTYVIETIRDISDCKIVDLVEDKTVSELKKTLSEINRLIVIDELTKCYNRRYINEKLPIDIESAKANKIKAKPKLSMIKATCLPALVAASGEMSPKVLPASKRNHLPLKN